MDPLLDLLRDLHLTGGVFLEAEFSAPWRVTAQVGPDALAAFFPSPSHVISYHYVIEGRCLLDADNHPPTEVRAGSIVLLPRNDLHRLGSATDIPAIRARELIIPSPDGGLMRIVHGGGGERTRLVCGFLATNTANPPIASVLPAALTIDVDKDVAGAWIQSSFRFAAQELAAGRPDSPAVVARIAELLFVEAVRRHVASVPSEQGGWLSGLRDPIVGRALALIHGKKAHSWSVPELARETGASRSTLADRFTTLIGESPMRYLSRLRLRLASQRLRESQDGITSIAFEVGYESEASFSRAFKREFGKSPAAWRRE